VKGRRIREREAGIELIGRPGLLGRALGRNDGEGLASRVLKAE